MKDPTIDDAPDDEVLRALKQAAPHPPTEGRFWDDFTRDVRLAYDAAEDRRRRRRWIAPLGLGLAAVAALLLLTLRPSVRLALPMLPQATRPTALPPPEDLDEVPAEALVDVLAMLDADDDENASADVDDEEPETLAFLEPDLAVEDLTAPELERLSETLDGKGISP